MSNCTICENIGENRRFSPEYESLCDSDYITYLELLLDERSEEVTPESINSAFSRLKISCRPESESQNNKRFITKRRRR